MKPESAIRSPHPMLLFGVLAIGCNSIQATPELESTTKPLVGGILFGTRCSNDYEYHYKHTWPYTWERWQSFVPLTDGCYYFNDRFDDVNTKYFYYDLSNTQWRFLKENDDTYGGPDSVDFMLIATHGGVNTAGTEWAYAFWNHDVNWWSSQSELGNNGWGASFFASYSCKTMRTDGDLFGRMGPMFSGGLRIAMGAYDNFYAGKHSWGGNLANYLIGYWSQEDAWLYATYNAYSGNRPIVYASGRTESECYSRLYHTYLETLDLPRLTGSDVSWLCWNSL